MTEYEATEIKVMNSRQVFPICKRSGTEIKTGQIYVEVMVLSGSPRKKERFEQWAVEEYKSYLLDKGMYYDYEYKRIMEEIEKFKEKMNLSPDKIGTDETLKVETEHQQNGG